MINSDKAPTPFIRALKRDDYNKGDCDFSVTQLISPPQRTWLALHHKEMKASEYASFMALIGTAGHHIIESNVKPELGEIAEERYFADMHGARVSGQIDLYEDKTIFDYKFVGGDQKEPKADHTKQLHMNGKLAELNGLDVQEVGVVYIQRDWSYMRSLVSKDYADTPFKVFTEPYNPALADTIFEKTVKDHKAAAEGSPRPCTQEEQWRSPTKWAVKKPANKRARKLFSSKEEATEDLKTGEVIETRKGEATYCLHFCGFKNFCPQFTKEHAQPQ